MPNPGYRKQKRIDYLREILASLHDDDRSKPCIEWPFGKTTNGYGLLCSDKHWIYVHRLAYEISRGETLGEFHALHNCDNPSCFRPSHLFRGNQMDNIRDCIAKGRRRPEIVGEDHVSSKLTELQVLEIRSLYDSGQTTRAIGRLFKISGRHASNIGLRRSWKHL